MTCSILWQCLPQKAALYKRENPRRDNVEIRYNYEQKVLMLRICGIIFHENRRWAENSSYGIASCSICHLYIVSLSSLLLRWWSLVCWRFTVLTSDFLEFGLDRFGEAAVAFGSIGGRYVFVFIIANLEQSWSKRVLFCAFAKGLFEISNVHYVLNE